MEKIYINKDIFKIFNDNKNDNLCMIEMHNYLYIDKLINKKDIHEFNIFSDHINYSYIKHINHIFNVDKIILHLYTKEKISNTNKKLDINNFKLIYYCNDKNINNLYFNLKFINVNDLELHLMNNIIKKKTLFLFESQVQMLKNKIRVVKEIFNEVDIYKETIILTNNCNFNCKYCYQKHLNNSLDFNLFKTRLLQIVEHCFINKKNKIVIRLFGGEPFLNKDCIHYICELFRFDINVDIQITTNGYLLDQFVNDLNKLPNLFLAISFDGLKNSDRCCNFDDDCNKKVFDNITLASNRFNVQIIYSIYEKNYNDAKYYIDLFKSMNIHMININCINENISKIVKRDLLKKIKSVNIIYKNNQYNLEYKFNKSCFEKLYIMYFTLSNGFIYSDVNKSCSFDDWNERYLLKNYNNYPIHSINTIESNKEIIINCINNYLLVKKNK